jgi:hypothetical protein
MPEKSVGQINRYGEKQDDAAESEKVSPRAHRVTKPRASSHSQPLILVVPHWMEEKHCSAAYRFSNPVHKTRGLQPDRDGRDGCGALLGISGSFAFGWLGILLLRLNFPEFVASPSGFKALRRLFGIVTYRGQGQCPILNLEEGSDNFADAISL